MGNVEEGNLDKLAELVRTSAVVDDKENGPGDL